MKYFKYLLLLLLTQTALASNDYFFKYGLGLNNGPFPDTAAKIISVGRIAPLYYLLDYQLEAGVMVDNNQSNGAIGFLSPSVGIRTKETGLYASFFIGPALITQTDTRLASLFEFNNDLEVGIKDSQGTMIGVNYKHFSNAGLTEGNVGRDFFTIKLSLPF